MFERIIPFRYLSPDQREALRADADEVAFAPGEVLMKQGDATDQRLFLILEGAVRFEDQQGPRRRRTRIVTAGHYIGERAALFQEARRLEVRAIDPVRTLAIPGHRLLALVHESTAFAQALGSILRDKQGIFTPFDKFRVEVIRSVSAGSVDLGRLIPLYERLEPALHPGATGEEIDVGALSYAVRRLPENLTRTLSFYVTEVLPSLYADPDDRFTPVPTAARRRSIYEMMPGKNMVLVRDGVSDLVDFICCLCLYGIEARKVRHRVRDGGGLELISPDVITLLDPVWPGEAEARVREIALHHEDFRIEIHKELDNYNSAHAETWCKQIAEATQRLLGLDPSELPTDFDVHVISSNTHSVHNCISPWIGSNADRIEAWGREGNHPFTQDEWHERFDLVCALARDYLEAYPDQRVERARVEADSGILRLDWTAFTGIGVQLIDASRVQWKETDPGIPDVAPERPALIVNIDYAFGEQAEHIIANLTSLFGRNLASLNVLGKAGGLIGDRGDVLVASAFVEQYRDLFHAIPGPGAVDVERLRSRLPDRDVHVGNMLTVTGTLMQNRTMLHFNRHIWRCIGLEMEGACYLRPVLQSMDRGSVRPGVDHRFLYYTSDLPLRHDANLSARLRASEGVPPLYAATREVLTGILEASG